MKTTIDIPDKMLHDLIQNTGAHTKRDAILTAIEEFNRKKKIARLADVIGTFGQFMTTEELEKAREQES